jgi:hypothetical protein
MLFAGKKKNFFLVLALFSTAFSALLLDLSIQGFDSWESGHGTTAAHAL